MPLMFSASPIVIAILVIVFILAYDRLGKYFQKASPEILKYLDYGSFIAAIATGFILYNGNQYPFVRYLFFLSLIVYFITMRHTIYKDSSGQE